MVSGSPSLIEGENDNIGPRSDIPAEDVGEEVGSCVLDGGSVDGRHPCLLFSKTWSCAVVFGRLNSDSTWCFWTHYIVPEGVRYVNAEWEIFLRKVLWECPIPNLCRIFGD